MDEWNLKTETRKKIGLRLILKTIIYAFAIFGVIFILILLGVLGMIGSSTKVADVPMNTVLQIDFNTNYAELRGDDLVAEFSGSSVYSVYDLIKAINVAAEDDRVKAIAASINVTPLGLAQLQDISRAIEFFKSSGKEAYIFSSSMGSFGQGTKEYYLASFFDEIWLQPSAEIGITGVSIEVPFFKNILNKFGVVPEFYSRYEYKTAAASLTETSISKPYKEELNKLGKGLFNQMVDAIAYNRHLSVEKVKDLINKAPLFADESLNQGLADKLGYQQEMESFLERRYQAKTLPIDDYMSNLNDYQKDDIPLVAVLALEGAIDSGTSSTSPVNDMVIGSQSVIEQLDDLSKYQNLKALIVRINSPGGSYVASDEIWYALKRFKAWKSVPIVVSMSNYAASGGYFVALAGDYIIAEPATLTGSIGVLGGKMVLADLWKKLDINWAELKYGDNAGILSANHKFTPGEKKVFNRSLDRIYDDFTSKVAKARNLDIEQMDKIARGRVWLGSDALKLGLIDEIGGFEQALMKARELGGVKQGETFGMIYYPKQPSFQEQLSKLLGGGRSLPSLKILEKYGMSVDDLNMLFQLQYDTVLPPLKIEM